MRIELAAFTAAGMQLAGRLEETLSLEGETAGANRVGSDGLPLRDWVDAHFDSADALVFIGAAGIAVRAVARKLASKTTDPAVVVIDDCGRFVVSLLSGHIGGANALTARLAEMIGAIPVITTATDGRGVFAVDVWAKQNGMAILNPAAIKTVSAKLLANEPVRLRTGFPVEGKIPEGVVLADSEGDVVVDCCSAALPCALHLVPPIAVLGVGCRKGTDWRTIENAFLGFCRTADMAPRAFRRVCSIDLKKSEPGLVEFCQKRSLPFTTYSAAELNNAPGEFTGSEFVKTTTGVDNVCERSAVLGCGGRLRTGKTVVDGVAMAAAFDDFILRF